MEKCRAIHYVGRNARKSQDGSGQTSLRKPVTKSFAVHFFSNCYIDIGLYVQLECDYEHTQVTEFSGDSL
jgi:hypothetical protein